MEIVGIAILRGQDFYAFRIQSSDQERAQDGLVQKDLVPFILAGAALVPLVEGQGLKAFQPAPERPSVVDWPLSKGRRQRCCDSAP